MPCEREIDQWRMREEENPIRKLYEHFPRIFPLFRPLEDRRVDPLFCFFAFLPFFSFFFLFFSHLLVSQCLLWPNPLRRRGSL